MGAPAYSQQAFDDLQVFKSSVKQEAAVDSTSRELTEGAAWNQRKSQQQCSLDNVSGLHLKHVATLHYLDCGTNPWTTHLLLQTNMLQHFKLKRVPVVLANHYYTGRNGNAMDHRQDKIKTCSVLLLNKQQKLVSTVVCLTELQPTACPCRIITSEIC